MTEQTPLWVAAGLVTATISLIAVAIRTSPPSLCLHAPHYCKNMTKNFSGYCDDCLNDWGPGI